MALYGCDWTCNSLSNQWKITLCVTYSKPFITFEMNTKAVTILSAIIGQFNPPTRILILQAIFEHVAT